MGMSMVRVIRQITSSVTGPTVGFDSLFAPTSRWNASCLTLTVAFRSAPTSETVLVLVLLMVWVTVATLAMPGESPMTSAPRQRRSIVVMMSVVVVGAALKVTFFRCMPG